MHPGAARNSAGQAVNTFYLTAPATYVLTASMRDGPAWKPGYVGRCQAANMFLQGFGFSWTAIEFASSHWSDEPEVGGVDIGGGEVAQRDVVAGMSGQGDDRVGAGLGGGDV